MVSISRGLACGLLVCGLLAGCSGKTEGPTLIPVTGTVRYKNQPVEGATVVFLPQEHAFAATGKTDAEGRFELASSVGGMQPGAVPGSYRITVRKFFFTPEDVEVQLLPAKYGHVDRTGLTATLVEGEPNQIDLELTD